MLFRLCSIIFHPSKPGWDTSTRFNICLRCWRVSETFHLSQAEEKTRLGVRITWHCLQKNLGMSQSSIPEPTVQRFIWDYMKIGNCFQICKTTVNIFAQTLDDNITKVRRILFEENGTESSHLLVVVLMYSGFTVPLNHVHKTRKIQRQSQPNAIRKDSVFSLTLNRHRAKKKNKW